jgi:hypothetical protein
MLKCHFYVQILLYHFVSWDHIQLHPDRCRRQRISLWSSHVCSYAPVSIIIYRVRCNIQLCVATEVFYYYGLLRYDIVGPSRLA